MPGSKLDSITFKQFLVYALIKSLIQTEMFCDNQRNELSILVFRQQRRTNGPASE